MEFTAKLNRRETPYVIADEVFSMADGKRGRYLAHDNVNEATIAVFTQPRRQGERVLDYTIEKKEGGEWKTFLKVFSGAEKVYVSYESFGDTVEAEDVNELQQAAVNLDAELKAQERLARDHRSNTGNPHAVTKAQVGLEHADNTADLEKPVSAAQQAALDAEAAARRTADSQLRTELETAIQTGISADGALEKALREELLKQEGADTALQESIRSLEDQQAAHASRSDNPHGVTKAQLGLGEVENIRQASKAEVALHCGDTVVHITEAERSVWNDADSSKHDHVNKALLDGMDGVITTLDIDNVFDA